MSTPPTAEQTPDDVAQGRPPKGGRARTPADAARLLTLLTPREAQVLARLAAGDDVTRMAAALGIAPATARKHLNRTMRKLGVRTAEEAGAAALALLGTPPPSKAPDRRRTRPAAAPTPAPAPVAPTPPPTPAAPDTAPAPAVATPLTFEALYESAYGRLVQQVFLLTASRQRTLHCVNQAFGAALRTWPDVAGLPDPEGWVRSRAAEAALSPWHPSGRRRMTVRRLPLRRTPVRPADEAQAVLPDHDRLTDQDRALLRALRRLSRPQRHALVLHDGIGLTAAEVAVETESSLAAAEGRVWAARAALAAALPELVGPDPAGPGFGDRLSERLYRAGVRGCPAPHRPPVPVLSTRHRLRTATRTGGAAAVVLTMGVAMTTTLFGGGPGALFRPEPPTPHPVCTNAQSGSAGPAAPGGIPPGLRTAWCSSAPGRAAVLGPPPQPPVQAFRRPAAPDARLSVDAAGPPVPARAAGTSCTVWNPHPCAARPQAPPPNPHPLLGRH